VLKPLENKVAPRRFVSALATLFLVGSLAGCKTHSTSQYISPRVEGRVLDAHTRQPVKGVRVGRPPPGKTPSAAQPPKGGQVMGQSPTVWTRANGTFALPSERDLTFFGGGRYSVTVCFEKSGDHRLTTDYTLANADLATNGEPIVKTGDILLEPRAK
jgi:hypothetical protein